MHIWNYASLVQDQVERRAMSRAAGPKVVVKCLLAGESTNGQVKLLFQFVVDREDRLSVEVSLEV